MRIEISRNGQIQQYEVPGSDKTINIMQILDYIYQNLDHTLAYHRHSACCQGICGRCVIKANGKTVLACVEKVEPGVEVLTLEAAGKTPVRDLVTANKSPFQNQSGFETGSAS
jgi:succinate dehydrogenase/fumarate reductase-like Fe-S protein